MIPAPKPLTPYKDLPTNTRTMIWNVVMEYCSKRLSKSMLPEIQDTPLEMKIEGVIELLDSGVMRFVPVAEGKHELNLWDLCQGKYFLIYKQGENKNGQ